MRPARGFTAYELAGTDTVIGIVGINVLTPTPPAVTAGTAGKVGAGKREVVDSGVCVLRA